MSATGRLAAVPSFHYAAYYAGQVRRTARDFAPTAIAVEAPTELTGDVDWAVSCWPTPVCLAAGRAVHAFVPGDSIYEALCLAQRTGAGLHLVDIACRRRGDCILPLPDPTLAEKLGTRLSATAAAIVAVSPRPRADVAREAAMAGAVHDLLERGHRVLWVGGLAHWRPIEARLASGDHAAPRVARSSWRDPRRLRLAPHALLFLTGMYPWLVGQYAADPDSYSTEASVRELALISPEGADVEARDDGSTTPSDVTRVLTYARNLAATARVACCPTLHELVEAAAAVVGRGYAGRLLALALDEPPPSGPSADLPRLEPAPGAAHGRYRVGRRLRRLIAGWPGASEAPVGAVDSIAGDDWSWVCHPADERDYVAFVRYLMRLASRHGAPELRSAPFLCGFGGGIDPRETLRHRSEGRPYVRARPSPSTRVAHAIIDWEHDREEDPRLHRSRGWIEPSFRSIGSASIDGPYETLLADPLVLGIRRDVALLSLDPPTWIPADDSRSLYGRVVQPLLCLPPSDDHLYGWLRIFFANCAAGRVVAWFSRYVPGRRIHEVAREHDVQVLPVPLSRIPPALLRRNRSFRFARLGRDGSTDR